MRFSTSHLLTHGSGALRQWSVEWRGRKGRVRCLRFSVGGYGNVRPPVGFWRWYPSLTVYHRTAYYLHWLSFSLAFLPNRWGSWAC